jgi:hypothetical protein
MNYAVSPYLSRCTPAYAMRTNEIEPEMEQCAIMQGGGRAGNLQDWHIDIQDETRERARI